MSNELQHDKVEELLGAYALDAVDADERAAVDRHLAECPRCRAEVDAHLEMAGALGSGVETPPAELWDRIADRLTPVRGTVGERPMPVLGGDRQVPPATITQASAEAPVDELSRARSARGPGTPKAFVALATVAAAAVIVIALLAVNLGRVDNRVNQIQSAVGGQNAQAVINQALNSPGHRLVSLKSPTGERLAEFVVVSDGRGYMVHSAMPALPDSETYQLWGVISGKPISLGLLGSHPSQAGFTVAGNPGPSELAVTIEPAGGVASPDRSPVASGTLVA